MTKDEIMEMWNEVIKYAPSEVRITKFAKMVAQHEREACAKVCDRIVEGKDPDDIHSDSQWAALSLAAAIRARGEA